MADVMTRMSWRWGEWGGEGEVYSRQRHAYEERMESKS